MKVDTTILHFAHQNFDPYWVYDPGQKDPFKNIPPFDSATVRSRDRTLVKVPESNRSNFSQYPATVEKSEIGVHDLLDELVGFYQTSTINADRLVGIKNACGKRPQIMICIHGYAHDADHAYVRADNAPEHKIHYKVLSNFIWHFIKDTSTPVNILLSMCYAARSRAYKKDHEKLDQLTTEDIESSFAYKFFNEFLMKNAFLKLRLTARTGALAFDYAEGRSLVQSEKAILASERIKEIKAEIEEIEDVNSHGYTLSQGINRMVALKKEFRQARPHADATPKTPKYGKLIYSSNGSDDGGSFRVKVESRHPTLRELLRKPL